MQCHCVCCVVVVVLPCVVAVNCDDVNMFKCVWLGGDEMSFFVRICSVVLVVCRLSYGCQLPDEIR